jgi:CubicO group peptidase (beta-lactamase class C family)
VSRSSDIATAIEDLAGRLDEWHVPGLQVTVVADGEVVHAGGLGVRGVDDPAPVARRTLFQHGSCGKAYTGLLAALLAADGTVDLDAPVRRYVPELRLRDSYVADHVTLRDLLSHRSGFPRHDLIWIFDQDITRAELIRRLEFLPMLHEPRTTWSYSNLGFALAGLALGRATDSTWEEQLRLRVLEPLGMSRTFTTYEDIPTDDVARPHLLRDEKPVETNVRRLNAAAPAGQVVTCADDAARWLLLQAGEPLLPAQAVKVTHTPAILLPNDAMPFAELGVSGYGLGWGVGTYRGRPTGWHSGGVDGYATQTMVLPAYRLGVTVSANLNNSQLPMAAMLHLADVLLGETAESSWFERVRGMSDEESEPVDKPSPEAKVAAPPAHPLDDYVGSYYEPAYGELVVTRHDGELAVRVAGTELGGTHRHYETWDLRYPPLEVDLAVTFFTGADGTVSEAISTLDDATDPIRFRRVPV